MKYRSIKAEIVLICILLVNVFILFINKYNLLSILSFFNLCFIYFIFYIILPFMKHIKKGQFNTKSIRTFSILRILTGTAIYFTLYQIYFSKDYTLKYTYYILFMALFLSFFIHILDLLADINWNQKNGRGRNNILPAMNLIIITALFLLFCNDIFTYVSIPKSSHDLKNIKVPESITVYKNVGSKVLVNGVDDGSNVVIDNPADVQTIINDLNSHFVKTFTAENRLNYIRMKDANQPTYTLVFNYDDKGSLENNYLPSMEITANRFSVIADNSSKSHVLYGTFEYADFYPVSLSDDTLILIFNYIRLMDKNG